MIVLTGVVVIIRWRSVIIRHRIVNRWSVIIARTVVLCLSVVGGDKEQRKKRQNKRSCSLHDVSLLNAAMKFSFRWRSVIRTCKSCSRRTRAIPDLHSSPQVFGKTGLTAKHPPKRLLHHKD